MPHIAPLALAHFPRRRPDLAPALTASPPIEELTSRGWAELAEKSSCNAVHLDLAATPAETAGLLAAWVQGGLLEKAPPRYYILCTEFEQEGEVRLRFDLWAGLRVSAWGSEGLQPSERTVPGGKDAALAVLREVRAHLRPVIAAYEDETILVRRIGISLLATPPFIRHIAAEQGVVYRLWAVPPQHEAELAAMIADHTVYVVDGHHQVEAALALAREENAAPGYILASLTNAAAPGVRLGPYHRVMSWYRRFDWERALERAQERFEVREALSPGDLETSGHPCAFILALKSGYWLLSPLEGAQDGLPGGPELARVPAHVLEMGLFQMSLGMSPGDVGGGDFLYYRCDARQALAEVADGSAQAAFLLKRPDLERLKAAVTGGHLLPRRSTCLAPKPPVGLLYQLLDA